MANLPPQSPASLIELFNLVLARVSSHASRVELQSVQWPLPEFAEPSGGKVSARATTAPVDWNSPQYLASINTFLTSLSLSSVNYRDVFNVGGQWEDKVAECLSCVSSLLHVHPAVGSASQTALLILSR